LAENSLFWYIVRRFVLKYESGYQQCSCTCALRSATILYSGNIRGYSYTGGVRSAKVLISKEPYNTSRSNQR
jgi:hypothetical protein